MKYLDKAQRDKLRGMTLVLQPGHRLDINMSNTQPTVGVNTVVDLLDALDAMQSQRNDAFESAARECEALYSCEGIAEKCAARIRKLGMQIR